MTHDRYDRPKRPPLFDLLIGIGVLGLLARCFIAYYSLGSNDIVLWRGFATEIATYGLGRVYETNKMFNHPPLIALLASKLYAFSVWTDLRFELVFKAPVVLADALSAWLVLKSWNEPGSHKPAAAFALFCWNPVSLLVTAYHGNTDSLCAAISLLAATLARQKLCLWAGVALAAAINVKLIPAVLVPVLLVSAPSFRELARFIAGLSVGALPFVVVLLTHFEAFSKKVIGWRSYPGEWGITEVVRQVGLNPRFASASASVNHFYIEHGSRFVLGFSVAVAAYQLYRRRFDAQQLAAVASLGFLVFAPGWGVQYSVYVVPLLFAAQIGSGALFAWVTGSYLLLSYAGLWTGTRPFYSDFSQFYFGQPVGARHLAGIAWGVTLSILIQLLGSRRRFIPTDWETAKRRPENLTRTESGT